VREREREWFEDWKTKIEKVAKRVERRKKIQAS